MPNSLSSTACSSPTNDSLEKVIKNDAVRYQRKGYGLISAVLITISFFYLVPKIFEAFWPFALSNMSENAIIFLGGNGFHTGMHIIGNSIMYCIYKSKLPFFEKYRISNKPWPWESDPALWKQLIKKNFWVLVLCHVVITPLLTIIDLNAGVKMRLDMETFPSIKEIMVQIFFFMICEDFFFYWSHRLLHHPKIYPYIHKVHHEYNTTVSIASEYVHPIEFIFGNILPTNSGAKILGSRTHFVTYCIWMIIRILETTDGHSGYEFSWSPYRLLPLSGSSIYHNFHHSHNVGNYGSFFTLWDTLCGSNKHFFKYLSEREKKHLEAKIQPKNNKSAEKEKYSSKKLERNMD